ncbi:MAG: MBL fold metallo-hydrolase [Acidobacteriota bacterium]|nr:MBL fold metallo-hydrolase [Acidobacteriota bacterium]
MTRERSHEAHGRGRLTAFFGVVVLVVTFAPLVVSFEARATRVTDVYAAPSGDILITPLIHSSVQIEHAGTVIQIDPWSQGDLSQAKPADLILVTDDPGHHLDVKAIARLRKAGAPVVIPRGVEPGTPRALKAVPDGILMGNGDAREIAGIRVEAIGAYDLTPGEPYHPKGEANGYVMTIGGARLYVAGVTQCVPEIRALRGIDVAFFPLNLPLTRMEPDAAIDCLEGLSPKVVYPYHYDQDWVTKVGRGEPRPVPTTRGLAQLKAALAPAGIEVRLAEWYPSR